LAVHDALNFRAINMNSSRTLFVELFQETPRGPSACLSLLKGIIDSENNTIQVG